VATILALELEPPVAVLPPEPPPTLAPVAEPPPVPALPAQWRPRSDRAPGHALTIAGVVLAAAGGALLGGGAAALGYGLAHPGSAPTGTVLATPGSSPCNVACQDGSPRPANGPLIGGAVALSVGAAAAIAGTVMLLVGHRHERLVSRVDGLALTF
jgi:hypothetical protein